MTAPAETETEPKEPDAAPTKGSHPGGMIALVPADPDSLTVDGGDPAEELHLTLAYLGDDVSGWSDERVNAILAHARTMAENTPPIEARIMGHALWNPDGGPDGDMEPCAVYQIQGNDKIDSLNSFALEGAHTAIGSADMPKQHSPFMAHVTAGYGIKPAALSAVGPITFDKLRVELGSSVTDYELGSGNEFTPVVAVPGVTGFATEAPATKPIVPEKEIPTETPDLNADNGIPVTFPVMVVEGLPTADGRNIAPGSLTHRALPIPILAQTKTPDGGEGHDGADVVGRIDTLTRVPGPEVTDKETGQPFPEGTFVWAGTGFIDPDAAATRLVQKRYLTGNSVDLTEVDADIADEEEGAQPGIMITSGKIAATTLVAIPAFAQAYIQLDGETVTPNEDALAASASLMWRSSELGDDCLLCLANATDGFAVSTEKRKKATADGHAMPDGSYPIETPEDLDNAIKAVGRGGVDHDEIRAHIIKQAKRLKLEDRIPDNWNPDGSLKEPGDAPEDKPDAKPFPIKASAVKEIFRPLDWFVDPQLDGPTPLTVDDNGQVYGHIATWGTCHIGMAGQCIQPPHSQTDYAYFRTGAVRVQDLANDGATRDVSVGHLTLRTGHAHTSLSARDTAAHYDDTGTAAADVGIGEDAYGVWVAGAVRRGTSPEVIAELRASPISGDWRAINGNLELVAALAVNVPGFPIPRARVASGAPVALVAAGVLMTSTQLEARRDAALSLMGLDLKSRQLAARKALAMR